MEVFKGRFVAWTVGILIFFTLANCAGVVRPMGLLPFRMTGFPFTFAAWGFGIKEYFAWEWLLVDAFIAIVTAFGVAYILTRSFLRRVRK